MIGKVFLLWQTFALDWPQEKDFGFIPRTSAVDYVLAMLSNTITDYVEDPNLCGMELHSFNTETCSRYNVIFHLKNEYITLEFFSQSSQAII